ncbi:hypothetical protein SOVF_177910, partial [Spinacia oleracea]
EFGYSIATTSKLIWTQGNTQFYGVSIDEEPWSAQREMHDEFLRMKRNLKIVSNFHLKHLEAKSAVKHASYPLLSDDDLDPGYYAMMQELAKIVILVQNMPGGLSNEVTKCLPLYLIVLVQIKRFKMFFIK